MRSHEKGELPLVVLAIVAAVTVVVAIVVVVARHHGSEATSGPSPVSPPSRPAGQTKAPKSPQPGTSSDPRLEGTWQFTYRVRSSSVSSLTGKTYSFVEKMVPKCGSGACDTVTKPSPSVTLKQKGSAYRGAVSESQTASCSGASVAANFSLKLQVNRTGTANGNTVATRLTGTAKQSGPASGGCASFSVSYSVSGNPTSRSTSPAPALPTVSQARQPVNTGGGGGGGNTGNTGNGGNTGNTGNGGNTGNTGNTGNSGNTGNGY